MLRLWGGRYREIESSMLVPGLTTAMLGSCVEEASQSAAVRRLRTLVRDG